MVNKLVRIGFKIQTEGMIKKLIKENRLMFVSDNKLEYTDKSGKKTEYTFDKFAKFVVTTLVMKVEDDNNIQRLAKENGLTSLSVISSTGISDEQVLEVLNEQYKRSHKK